MFWILVGPRSAASSRIHGYRIHEFLLAQGWASCVLMSPLHWVLDVPLEVAENIGDLALDTNDAVVFQKVRGPGTVKLLKALRKKHVYTVYVDCDIPLKLHETALASVIVCSSAKLAEDYRRAGIRRATYIPDAFESCRRPRERGAFAREFQCVWFGLGGSPGTWETVQEFREQVMEPLPRWSFTTISNHPHADTRWNLATCWDTIAGADAVAIPSRTNAFCVAKSCNRATQAMALGVPVLAYPIPSYAEVIRNGVNGFLCCTPAEWQSAFQSLQTPETWTRVSNCGYRYARRHFSIERVGGLWARLLATFGQKRCGQQSRLVEQARAAARLRSLYWNAIADRLPKESVLRGDYRTLAANASQFIAHG